jgi:hypothetical protein
MKTLLIIISIGLLSVGTAIAQRGDIFVPTGAVITVPAGAQICADKIYANNPGWGTLTIANASCLCAGMAIVPVELLTFTASKEDGLVSLRWSTASETNCHGFEVQRLLSVAGEEWRPITFVQGAGTTTITRDYLSIDRLENVDISGGSISYRLKMIDLDGSFAYSNVVELRFDAAATTFAFYPVHPNPASDKLNISFSLSEASDVTVTVYATTGAEAVRLIEGRSFDRGNHTASIPTAGLSRGTYLIELRAGKLRKTQTIMIQN